MPKDKDNITPVPDRKNIMYYRQSILDLVEEYKQFLNPDPEKADIMLTNNNTFTGCLKYIAINMFDYNQAVANGSKYACIVNYSDFKFLDDLFSFYLLLCGKYKQRISIQGYCIMVDLGYTNILSWRQRGMEASPDCLKTLQKWFAACEQSHLSSDKVMDMFLLKAVDGYRDDLPQVKAEDVEVVSELPTLDTGYLFLTDKKS